MAIFDDDILGAREDIAEFGESVTWRQLRDPDLPDPNKPWEPGTKLEVDYPVSILFLRVKKEDKQYIKYLKGTEIEIGTSLGLMAGEVEPLTFTPNKKDVVIRNGKQISIDNLDPVHLNSQFILWYIEFSE